MTIVWRSRIPVVMLALTACATSTPRAPMGRYSDGDLRLVRDFYERQLREGDPESAALWLNGLAQAELMQGDVESARRHFLLAGRIMGNWQVSTGEVLGAVLGAESSKTWKGDPHEKFMNAFYSGLLYWFAGEPDNARACFKKGILADAESEEGGRTDCALLYWLAGRASLSMGLPDDAADFFEEARDARRFSVEHGARGAVSNPVLARPYDGNLLCLVGLGYGPRKIAFGPHGSRVEIVPALGGAMSAELFLNDRSIGRTSLLVDLDYQAMSRGGRMLEGIREGKAVFRDASTVAGLILVDEGLRGGGGSVGELTAGLGLLMLSLLTDPRADARHWEILPRTVHALVADVEPGEHELDIAFFDASGNHMRDLDQAWFIEVPERGEGVYYFHSLPNLDRSL